MRTKLWGNLDFIFISLVLFSAFSPDLCGFKTLSYFMEIFSPLSSALQPRVFFGFAEPAWAAGGRCFLQQSRGHCNFSGDSAKVNPTGQGWQWHLTQSQLHTATPVSNCALHGKWSAQAESEVWQPPTFILSSLPRFLTSEDPSCAAPDSSMKSHAFFIGKLTTALCSWIACKSLKIAFPTQIEQYFHREGK